MTIAPLYKEAFAYPAVKYLLKGLQAGPIGRAVNKTLVPGIRWLETRTERLALQRLQQALQKAVPSVHSGAVQLPGGQNVSIQALQELGLRLPVKTAKAHRLSRRITFRDLQISIETDKGEKRHWHDPHEHKNGTTLMKHPYGYIRRTEGVDGDHVDVYVGPNEEAKNVYVVHQMKAPDFKKFDEDKCMLGFDTLEEAKKAYLAHYNKPDFLGSVTTMPFEEFKEKVMKTFDHPKKIATAIKTALNLQQALKIEGLLGRQEAASLFHEVSRQSGELGKSAIRSNPQTLQITAQGVKRMPLATQSPQTKLSLMRGIHKVPGAIERILPQAQKTVTRAGATAGQATAGPAASRMFDDVMQEARRRGSARAAQDIGLAQGPWG